MDSQEQILQGVDHDSPPATESTQHIESTNEHDDQIQEPEHDTPAEEGSLEAPTEEADVEGENQPLEQSLPQDNSSDSSATILEKLTSVESEIAAITNAASKTSSEMRDLHRLYHNEFAGRLKSMQDELDRYHELDRGRVFDDILRSVAQIYCDHYSLTSSVDDEKTQKRIEYLFLDMLQLLEGYGVHIHQSHMGDKRDVRFCQVIERNETSDPSLHDTIARSKSPGFYTDKRPLIKEMIDVYVYKKPEEASKE